MSQEVIISGLQVLQEDGWRKDCSVIISQGKIKQVSSSAEIDHAGLAQHYQFPAECYLVPGLIDLHIHGADGCDVMDASYESLQTISNSLAADGVTSFLATTMTDSIAKIEAAITCVAENMQALPGAAILGVHLEGPFLAKNKAGAQTQKNFQEPQIDLFKKWQQLAKGQIKIVTIAPELAGALELINYLRQQQVKVSMGHSEASYDEALAAIAKGASHATHLFNAMNGLHHREPGMVTAALLQDVFVELIADGVHLHPAILELAYRMKGKDKIMLVTDAMRAKCLGDGCYDLGGQEVLVESGEARLKNGVLAGSTLSMPVAIQNMAHYAKVELAEAFYMASCVPAKQLGLSGSKGSIAVGMDADLAVFGPDLQTQLTMRAGKIVFRGGAFESRE